MRRIIWWLHVVGGIVGTTVGIVVGAIVVAVLVLPAYVLAYLGFAILWCAGLLIEGARHELDLAFAGTAIEQRTTTL